MKKRRAHYSLDKVKQLIKQQRYDITTTAMNTALGDFSMAEKEIVDTILSLKMSDLYKSMTDDYKLGLWLDVYYKRILDKTAYIKLQINKKINEDIGKLVIIISFKER